MQFLTKPYHFVCLNRPFSRNKESKYGYGILLQCAMHHRDCLSVPLYVHACSQRLIIVIIIIIIIIIIMRPFALLRHLFQHIAVTTQHFNSVLFRDFRCPRLRCLAIPAFDFNFLELLTLGVFTTEGKKKKKRKQ